MKFDKPYEIIEGWKDFVQYEFEKVVVASNFTFAEPQPVAKVNEVKKDKTITSKETTGFYISTKSNLWCIDFETESEKEIYATGGLRKKDRSASVERTEIETSLLKLKLEEIVVTLKNSSSTERRDDARKRKRKRSAKYL